MSRQWPPFDPFDRGPFQRRPIPEMRIPRLPRRFWFGVGLIGLVVLLLFILGPLITFFSDLLWFGGLGLRDVYLTRAGIGWGLFFASLLIALAFLLVYLLLALRLRLGAFRTIGIRRRYNQVPAGWTALAVSAFVAVIVSAGAAGHWTEFALATHYSATGRTEPVFNQDVAFYLLTLPFLHAAVNWAISLCFLSILIVGALYVWRAQGLELRLSRLAIAHLSGLLAVLALLIAVASWISRYDYLYSHNAFVWGAGYTDINARIGLTTFAAVLAVLLAIALAVNVGLRLLWLPVAAVAVWLLFGVISGIYAGLVQRLSVAPAELSRERPYIQREIQFTRAAYGLDKVATTNYAGDTPVGPGDVTSDRLTIDNLRLWDYRPLLDTYTQLQTIRTYYSFHDIDLDRYTLNGKYQQLELSARELDTAKLPPQAQTWVNDKLKYTHGFGVAASPVNAVAGEGVPAYVAHDIPVAGQLSVSQPSIYFGETTADYVLAP